MQATGSAGAHDGSVNARPDVAVVGAGPVGLLAGILLAQSGADVVVLERRSERPATSRAIGIHPPALSVLERAGVSADLVGRGVRIPGGEARSRGRRIAEISFGALPGAYPFVLSVPQAETERVLERRLRQVGAEVLRGVEVTDVMGAGAIQGDARNHDTSGRVESRRPEERVILGTDRGEVSARFVIAADGARSTVREAVGLGGLETLYPDTYLMGDFPERGAQDPRAIVYLERAGVVESFPLPGGKRRWVVRTESYAGGTEGQPAQRAAAERSALAEQLADVVRRRTGVRLDPASNSMVSPFRVRRRIADGFVAGRVALAGDAAHEVSPIGGQGMNLGWMDVGLLVPVLMRALHGFREYDVERELTAYSALRRRAAIRAARQAHLNMALGRPLPGQLLAARNLAMTAVVSRRAVHDAAARAFTMAGELGGFPPAEPARA